MFPVSGHSEFSGIIRSGFPDTFSEPAASRDVLHHHVLLAIRSLRRRVLDLLPHPSGHCSRLVENPSLQRLEFPICHSPKFLSIVAKTSVVQRKPKLSLVCFRCTLLLLKFVLTIALPYGNAVGLTLSLGFRIV